MGIYVLIVNMFFLRADHVNKGCANRNILFLGYNIMGTLTIPSAVAESGRSL